VERKTLQVGRTLLVGGPASVKVIDGSLDTVGVTVSTRGSVVIRCGRILPVKPLEASTVEVTLGEGGSMEEIEGNPFPEAWLDTVADTVAKRFVKVMVVGDTDSGKTTFCTLLVNQAVKEGLKVALVDGDIGQADIGPPTTVSLAVLKKQTVDLFTSTPEKVLFMGATTPCGLIGKVVEGVAELGRKALELGAEFVVFNTDGWVDGEAATLYKIDLAANVGADVVFLLQTSAGLQGLTDGLKGLGLNAQVLPVPAAIKPRSREVRKGLRELGYKKGLRDLTCRTLPLGWFQLENTVLGSGMPLTQDRVYEFSERLGGNVLYGEEKAGLLVLVVDGDELPQEASKSFVEAQGRDVHVIHRGVEKGLISALLDKNREFQGLGIIDEIDYVKRVLKVYTPYTGPVSIVQLGQVKLDRDGRELAQYPYCPI